MTASPTRTSPDRPSERAPKILYCDGPRLRRVLLAASEYVGSQRSELDRINVFPVADGDTGTNLTLTLRSVADAVRDLEAKSVSEVAGAAAEASVLGARGNSGMLLSHFLLGFARGLGDRIRAGTREVASALTDAASALTDALERPVEGTILTVAREVAEVARRRAAVRRDFYQWLHEVKRAAHRSLESTRELLPVLRQAGVVDAGAKGFVNLIEATLRLVEGRTLAPDEGRGEEGTALGPEVAASPEEGGAGEGRYCTQIGLRGELPGRDEIRRVVGGLGTSFLVVRSGSVGKVHIHTDEPDEVERRLAGLATVVDRRVEDTRARRAGRAVAVVTDSSCDLPPEWTERVGVEVVPLRVILGDHSFRDGVDLDSESLLEALREPDGPIAQTSQPPPGDFLAAYREALGRDGTRLLGVFLSGGVSGTFDSAAAAARRLEDVRWELVDSRSGSLGLGMLVRRAVELLDGGWSFEDVAAELRRIRDRSGIFFTVAGLEWLLRSGRVSRGKAWLGDLLGLLPILTVDREGRIAPRARARGSEAARERILELVEEELAGRSRYRLGVAHAGIPEEAGEIAAELRRRLDPLEVHVRPVTAVLAAHLGPGAWGVCYQVEDGAGPAAG